MRRNGLALLLMVAGAVVIGYPHASQWVYNRIQQSEVSEFRGKAAEMTSELKAEFLREAMQVNEMLYRKSNNGRILTVDPFAEVEEASPENASTEDAVAEEDVGEKDVIEDEIGRAHV